MLTVFFEIEPLQFVEFIQSVPWTIHRVLHISLSHVWEFGISVFILIKERNDDI